MNGFEGTGRGALAAVVLAALLALGACANQTSETYSAAETGEIMTTARAVVLSSRKVHIEGGETGAYGPAVGAAAGGAGGFYNGGGSGADSAIIAGHRAQVGAGLGYAAEEFADSREGIEYVLRDDATGRTITVVQNAASGEIPIPPGTRVLLQRGDRYVRVLPAPVTE
jgi:outer membrane lipoprotein SlyB